MTGTALGEADDTLTSPDLLVRAALPFASPANRTLFKEISPCRLVDTRQGTNLPAPYGNLYGREGGDFASGESRNYRFAGDLVDGNPCDSKIPAANVVALTLQVWVYNEGNLVGSVSFTTPFVPKVGQSAFMNYAHGTTVQAGQVQISDSSTFTLVNSGSPADIAVDILGYHTPDTDAVGPAGPAGIGNMTMERKCSCFVTSTATVTFSKPVYFVLSQYENMDGKLAAQPINYAGSEGRSATFNGSVGRNFCAYNFSQ